MLTEDLIEVEPPEPAVAVAVATHAPAGEEEVPHEVRDALCLLGLLSGGANVVMQLSHLPVGHGVAKSKVESGRADRHPLKRGRTTSAFLAVALLGTDEERLAMRAEIARAHRHVHSEAGDPVEYNAFDPKLQLWVAACLYKGAEDIYARLYGRLDPERREILYRYARRLGTTLQVRDEMWPPSRAAFDDYWNRELAEVEMDDLTRPYLRSVADFTFLLTPLGRLGTPLKWLVRPLGTFITGGFLPERFREELGLEWNECRQRRFDRFIAVGAAITRALPPVLRAFPLNLYLWDTRRRLRLGRPVV
jgi:uncharacterized protein (DUF2236 family)